MRYYPVYLDIKDRQALVVGGGSVGSRKARTLLDCGAVVTVVSTEAGGRLVEYARQGRIELIQRPYRSSDLDGVFLVIGATNDEALNRKISADAHRRGKLCNIADRPEACNFILPSIVNRGDLTIAVSTAGKSPAFAKYLRKRLEKGFGPEYVGFLRLMGAVRSRLLAEAHDPEAHKPIFEQLIDAGLLEMIRNGNETQIDSTLKAILGPGYTWAALVPEESEKE